MGWRVVVGFGEGGGSEATARVARGFEHLVGGKIICCASYILHSEFSTESRSFSLFATCLKL